MMNAHNHGYGERRRFAQQDQIGKGPSYERMLKGAEKFLNKSLKLAKKKAKKSFAVVLKKVVTMVTPAKPPPKEDVVYMTYIISVEKEVPGWQKSIIAILKKVKGTRNFSMDQRGRIVVSGASDLKAFLIGVAKAKNANLDWIQSGHCPSNLHMPPPVRMPQVRGQGYVHGHPGDCEYENSMRPFHGGYGYGDDMRPFRGGYGGGHHMGSGYNPMGYNHNYNAPGNMPYDYNYGTQARSFMNDERINNCPCSFDEEH